MGTRRFVLRRAGAGVAGAATRSASYATCCAIAACVCSCGARWELASSCSLASKRIEAPAIVVHGGTMGAIALEGPSAEPASPALAPPPGMGGGTGRVADGAKEGTDEATSPDQVSTSRLFGWIYEKPRSDAPHSGYLRAGARVARGAAPVAGAPGGGTWYAVKPAGFVCVGRDGVTTDLDHPTVRAAAAYPPHATEPFPYGYGTSNGTPLYTRVPTPDEQRRVEGEVSAHLAAVKAHRDRLGDRAPPELAMAPAPLPGFLDGHRAAPSVLGWLGADGETAALTAGYAWSTMRLAFVAAFREGDEQGRAFYLTTEHLVVPADRVRAAKLADFQGVELAPADAPGEHLPIVWVRWRPASVYSLDDAGTATPTEATLPFQAHASIAPRDVVVRGVRFFEISGDQGAVPQRRRLVRASDVTRIDAVTELPSTIAGDELWIEVGLGRQSLVLYRGLTPVFATLVSTGVDGTGPPETTRSTPRGHFRIHSKHVSYRMSAEEHPPWTEGGKPDPRYRIDDVPHVQYFQGGYALHAAYWHDAFGQPKSHGCINLSPRDAAWLFERTAPTLPAGWHGVYGGRSGAALGTYVVIRH